MLVEKLFDHITNWSKFWFGLIFLGSIINELANQSGMFISVSVYTSGLMVLAQ